MVQDLHVMSLLYHLRNKTLPLVMRPNPSTLPLVVFLLLPQFGSTALIRASENGHDSVVEMLLAARANHDHKDNVRKLVTWVMLIHVPSASVSNKVLHLFLGQ